MCRIFFDTMARIFLLVRLVTKEISVPYIDFNENVRSMYIFLVDISTSYDKHYGIKSERSFDKIIFC